MKCFRCGAIAVCKVGLHGFCRVHRYEATREQSAVIRSREFSAGEYERHQKAIGRAMRAMSLRFRTRRPHA